MGRTPSPPPGYATDGQALQLCYLCFNVYLIWQQYTFCVQYRVKANTLEGYSQWRVNVWGQFQCNYLIWRPPLPHPSMSFNTKIRIRCPYPFRDPRDARSSPPPSPHAHHSLYNTEIVQGPRPARGGWEEMFQATYAQSVIAGSLGSCLQHS